MTIVPHRRLRPSCNSMPLRARSPCRAGCWGSQGTVAHQATCPQNHRRPNGWGKQLCMPNITRCCHECVVKGSRFRGLGVELRSLEAAFASATVRNRLNHLQPFAPFATVRNRWQLLHTLPNPLSTHYIYIYI